MKIYTSITLDMQTGEVISQNWYEYSGPIEELKKGSDAAKSAAAGAGKVGDTAQTLATSNQKVQDSARATADPFAKSLMPTKPGGLSPYSQVEFQNAKMNNATGAMDQRALGAKAMALRGFGGTPGTTASITNTINRNQGVNDNTAYQGALRDTLGQGLEGLKYAQSQQQIYDPNNPLKTATGAYGTQANAAQVMNSSPTLMGDIGMGLSGLAGAAGGIMTGMGGMGAKF